MLPNVRLLIAAMLASVLVLICGFGVFAAFRVSRDPIAHLPVAAPPSQLLAETRAASSAVMVAGEIADQHSRFDIPVSALEETAAPTSVAAQYGQIELVTESEQTATPPPIAAMDTEASAAAEPEKEAAAMAPPEPPPPPSTPVIDLPAPVQAGDRSADTAADAASAASPLRPVEPAADPSAGARETAPDASAANETAAGNAAPVGQTTTAEATPLKAPNAEPSPVTEPSAVASLPVEAMHALDRSEGDTLPEPPLPRARPIVSDAPRVSDAKHVSYAQHVRHAQPARAADERPRSVAAYRPGRARVVVVRSVRAVRFTAPYYARAQYAQSTDQSYGYGQSNFQGGQEQIVIRRVVRLHPARLAARRVSPGIGGPFVSARSP
jgi:hypothetical protein